MKVKMLVGLSGNEYSLSPGDERDFPDAEAIRLIEAQYAVPVIEVDDTETADRKPVLERRTGKKAK